MTTYNDLLPKIESLQQPRVRLFGRPLDQEFIDKVRAIPKAKLDILLSDLDEDLGELQPHLKLLSYDISPPDQLTVYSQAPINEMDILRAALCLVDSHNHKLTENWFANKPKSRHLLQYAQVHFHPHGFSDDKLRNKDLINFINILNNFIQDMAKTQRLPELAQMTLIDHEHHHFGEGYTESEIQHPFVRLLKSQACPKQSMHGTMIDTRCSFLNIHRGTFGAALPIDIRETPKRIAEPPASSWRMTPKAVGLSLLVLGIVALVIARVATGDIGAFFSLGAVVILGERIKGLPLAGVGLTAFIGYQLAKRCLPDRQFQANSGLYFSPVSE